MTVGLLLASLLAAATLVVRSVRTRARLVVATLVVTPVVLVVHVAGSDALDGVLDRPVLIVVGVVAGVGAVAALTVLLLRRPGLLAPLVAFALPFRVPIDVGAGTANLLVPLYAVVAAGALAYALPRLGERAPSAAALDTREAVPGWLERVLAATLVLYALQAFGSADPDKALENAVFFYVPFALLLVLVARLDWTRRLAARCLQVLAGLALAFALIGFVEYATKTLLLNPKVISSNQFETYFRVNSLFFDPNIYGRFLMVVMLGLAGALLWARAGRGVAVAGGALAVLWAGLVLTFSQSSFAGLLVGLAVLGGLRWGARRALAATAAVVVAGALVVLLAPGAINLDIGSSGSVDNATSGRVDLIEGGLRLAGEEPVLGWGSGAFSRAYRDQEDASAERAVSASHTIPVTVAAEQGVVGLLLYLALVALALRRLLAGAGDDPARAVAGAALCALLVHTLLYAAFLEDPITWALLGLGVGLARAAPASRRRARVVPAG